MREDRRHLRREPVGYALLALCALLFWFFTGAAAAGIALLLLLLYACFAFALTTAARQKVRAGFDAGGEAQKGDGAEAVLRAEYAGSLPGPCLLAEVIAENVISGERQSIRRLTLLRAKKETALRFLLSDAHCGLLRVRAERLFVTDPLSLFARPCAPATHEEARIYVMPAMRETEIEAIDAERYDMESYRFADRRVGSDPSETVGIRAYRAGDSVRMIHWKLSAKTGETLVREAGFPIDTKILLLIDKTMDEAVDAGRRDRATEMAAALSLALARRGQAHTAAWHDHAQHAFVHRSVADSAAAYEMARALIAAPFVTDGAHAMEQFLASDMEKQFAAILYVTTVEQTEAEQGMAHGTVAVYKV